MNVNLSLNEIQRLLEALETDMEEDDEKLLIKLLEAREEILKLKTPTQE